MKKLIFAIMILTAFMTLVMLANAAEQTITFEWDPGQDEIAGYNIYVGETATGPWSKLNPELIPGSETTYAYTYTEAVEAGRWFYITATDGRNESEPSNIVDCMVDTVAPGKIGTLTLSSD